MISSEIEILIIKFFTRSATKQDLDTLENWIQCPENQVIFKAYVKANFAMTLGMNDPDFTSLKEKLLKEIRKEKKIPFGKNTLSLFKYAAIFLLSLGVVYYVQQEFLLSNKNTAIVPKQEAITLQLDNGELMVISDDGDSHITNTMGAVIGKQHGKKLVYDKNTSESELKYNTLNVPFGRRFNLSLSDGTEVFLNAGSTIKYPVQFLPNKKRHVFLEGEAFFKVAQDKENLFTVDVNEVAIEVYGTKFNVSNYPEDKDTEVVLLKGSLGLTTTASKTKKNQPVLLEPGFKGAFDKTEKKIHLEKVNTELFTSWISGDMVFRNISFENIIKKLERQYNVTIVNKNKSLSQEHFNGTIETENETIEQVLSYFNTLYDINYSIVENTIVIN